MKINSDLRMAVRSAYNIQKKAASNHYEVRHKAEQAAIAALLKSKPKVAKALNAAKARIHRASVESAKANQVIKSFGLECGWHGDAYRLTDNVAFTKAGGHFTITESKRWTFDQVMAELAAADEKQAAAILKNFGINWT